MPDIIYKQTRITQQNRKSSKSVVAYLIRRLGNKDLLVKICGISRQIVRRWEMGDALISFGAAKKILKKMPDLSLQYLRPDLRNLIEKYPKKCKEI